MPKYNTILVLGVGFNKEGDKFLAKLFDATMKGGLAYRLDLSKVCQRSIRSIGLGLTTIKKVGEIYEIYC